MGMRISSDKASATWTCLRESCGFSEVLSPVPTTGEYRCPRCNGTGFDFDLAGVEVAQDPDAARPAPPAGMKVVNL